MRSAKNVPIREAAFSRIRNFQEEEQKMHRMYANMGMVGNMNMGANMNNYGMGFHQRAPNVNLQGQNFFVPGMMPNFGQNRQL